MWTNEFYEPTHGTVFLDVLNFHQVTILFVILKPAELASGQRREFVGWNHSQPFGSKIQSFGKSGPGIVPQIHSKQAPACPTSSIPSSEQLLEVTSQRKSHAFGCSGGFFGCCAFGWDRILVASMQLRHMSPGSRINSDLLLLLHQVRTRANDCSISLTGRAT